MNITNQLDLKGIHRTLQKRTFFASAYGIFSRLEYILGHNT